MPELTLVHPDRARLASFGRGLVNEEEMVEVGTHVAACEACYQVLSALPEDEFVGLLRTAHNHGDSASGPRDVASLTGTAPITIDVPGFEVPSSFVLHGSGSSSTIGATIALGDATGPDLSQLPLDPDLPRELADHPRLRYRIAKRLGIGGMGTVYLAEHRLMDRPVALKVIRGDFLGNEALVERFRREVKAAARLPLNRNIVAAHDAEQAGGSHFLVMEFVNGLDLAAFVKSRGPLPYELACKAVKEAAEGLEHAHQHGMVHRDIKPQNLMLTPDGQVKILDFGLARFASEALPDLVPTDALANQPQTAAMGPDRPFQITLTDMLLGTADYIAPEQASDPRSADIRADIYSLGCTLYYLLVGHPPFPDGNLAQKLASHAERIPRPLTEARADIPLELAPIVDRMMAKDRSRRFQRPAEVVER